MHSNARNKRWTPLSKPPAEHRLLSNFQRMGWLGAHGLNGSTRILEEALERCGPTVMTRN